MAEAPQKLDLQQRRGETTPRVDRFGAAERNFIRRGSRLGLAAVFATALSQLSCAAETEPMPNADNNAGTEVTVESQKGLGTANASFDGYDWYFEGSYPNDFEIVVYASPEKTTETPQYSDANIVTYETVMVGEEGNFKLRGYSGDDNNVWITVKAVNTKTGEEIVIGSNPPPDGMYGIASGVAVDKL